MDNKVALISGGTGYLGTHLARALVAKGWQVAALGRSAPTQAIEGVAAYTCDVADSKATEALVAQMLSQYGHLDTVIHAASAPMHDKHPIWESSTQELEAQVRTALFGAQALATATLPHLPKDAAFIGITSTLIEPNVDNAFMGPYVVGKYALRGFLRALAADTKSRGLRVYAVAPGYMPGGLNQGVPEAVLAMLAKKTGAGLSIPEDTAELVARLCTKPDAYPTGVSIVVSQSKAEPL